MLLPKVCEIIWNVKQLYDANKTDFDERNHLPVRSALHTRTRFIRDVLVHDVLRGFTLPEPIQAENQREATRFMRQRTNIIWDICQELNETRNKARSLAQDQVRRDNWIDSIDNIYVNYLREKISGEEHYGGDSDGEEQVDIGSDDEIGQLNVAMNVGDAENIFVN